MEYNNIGLYKFKMTSSIKKVNLEQMQRPKTLIVIHYRGKRVSIPIYESFPNIVEYLWHQLEKFENNVLNADPNHKNARNSLSLYNVVGFTALEQEKNKLDLKMNILLSMTRLPKDYGKSRTDLKQLDITNYYKYLQIQPYYSLTQKQLIPQYQLYSVLNQGAYFTTYLGRKISDGRFSCIKICRGDSKLAVNQYNAMKIIHNEQIKYDRRFDLEIIPQVDEVRKTDGLLVFIYEYCPGGNIKNVLSKQISEIECLHYMKQLIWGIHTLNTNFNLIHRAVSLENIQIDFLGNIRLTNYAYWQPCFANTYLAQSNVPESYDGSYEIPHVVTPPQVQRSGKYNHLVDYFGVGVVLQEIFNFGVNRGHGQASKEGIQIAIDNLLEENIRDRQLFINQIISELHEEKMKNYSSRSKDTEVLQNERLTFNQIYTGQSINLQEKVKNGIKHEDALRIMKPSNDDHLYFLNPVNKSRKKSKNKSLSKGKDKEKDKNHSSKDKLRSDSKERNKVRKISNEGSEKSLNKSIDSRNKSIKSNKSCESRERQERDKDKDREKVYRKKSGEKVKNKIPNMMNTMAVLKSPPKSPNFSCNLTNPKSPPKTFLSSNKAQKQRKRV